MDRLRRDGEGAGGRRVSPAPVEPRIPPLTDRALAYTWNQLLARAGSHEPVDGPPFSCAGIDLLYQNPDEVGDRERCVVVAPCRETAWGELLSLEEGRLTEIPIEDTMPSGARLPFGDVPVLLWGTDRDRREVPFVQRRRADAVVFHADIVAAAFFMLSRWEETVGIERDAHGRFPAHAGVALRQGFLDRPLVDEYALILGAWMTAIAPGSVSGRSRFSVRLSHDIDHVRSSPRSLAAGVLKNPSLRGALRAMRQLGNPHEDPLLRACYDLAETSEGHGFTSSFYFKASTRGPLDSGYDPKRRFVQRCMKELNRRGHEVGFHPGYRTAEDFDVFLAEKDRLEAALGQGTSGGRQHYLRFDVASTWRCWEAAGLSYDSTLGFADHEGFRCGTCHPYVPFSIDDDREYRLLEVPLIVMDATLRGYRGMTPEQAEQVVLEIAGRCRDVGGVFTLLWHNSSTVGTWNEWFAAYRRIVGRLETMVDSA